MQNALAVYVIDDAIGLEIIKNKKMNRPIFRLVFLLMVHFIELRTLFNRFENEMNEQHFKWTHSIVESKMHMPPESMRGFFFTIDFVTTPFIQMYALKLLTKKNPNYQQLSLHYIFSIKMTAAICRVANFVI